MVPWPGEFGAVLLVAAAVVVIDVEQMADGQITITKVTKRSITT